MFFFFFFFGSFRPLLSGCRNRNLNCMQIMGAAGYVIKRWTCISPKKTKLSALGNFTRQGRLALSERVTREPIFSLCTISVRTVCHSCFGSSLRKRTYLCGGLSAATFFILSVFPLRCLGIGQAGAGGVGGRGSCYGPPADCERSRRTSSRPAVVPSVRASTYTYIIL